MSFVITGLVLFFLLRPSNTYFIDNSRVVAHYVKLKGIDELLEEKKRQMQVEIDSASIYLNSIQGEKADVDTVRLAKELSRVNQLRQQFQGHLQAEDQRLSAEVRDELNSFIRSFSKKNGIDILFGATGGGNVLYAIDEIDITQELIEYIDEGAR